MERNASTAKRRWEQHAAAPRARARVRPALRARVILVDAAGRGSSTPPAVRPARLFQRPNSIRQQPGAQPGVRLLPGRDVTAATDTLRWLALTSGYVMYAAVCLRSRRPLWQLSSWAYLCTRARYACFVAEARQRRYLLKLQRVLKCFDVLCFAGCGGA